MLRALVEAAVIFLGIAGLSYMAGLAIAHSAEQSVRRRLKVEALDERIARLIQLQARFQRRRDEMLPRMVRLDNDVKSVKRRSYMVTRRVSDTKISRSRLLRVLGEEDAFHRPERPARRFTAHVINRHVQRAQVEQKEHPNLARSWSRGQRVDVWAPTIGDAKVMVDKAFPAAIGYFTVDIREAEGDLPELSDDEARTTLGRLGIGGDAVPGDYVLEVTARTNDGTYAATVTTPFTVLAP